MATGVRGVMRGFVAALMMTLLLAAGPVAASGGGSAPAGEETFSFSELRVPLADSDPVRIMAVRVMLVMATPEDKAVVRSKQKELEQELVSELSKVPTATAIRPAAPNDVKKVVSSLLTRSGLAGVKDVLIQKYLLW